MTMTQTLAPHLPFLRRYARALTGSQSSGDAYVRAALSALLSGEQTLDTKLAPGSPSTSCSTPSGPARPAMSTKRPPTAR